MGPPVLVPASPQWHNYSDALKYAPIGRWFMNTLIVTLDLPRGNGLRAEPDGGQRIALQARIQQLTKPPLLALQAIRVIGVRRQARELERTQRDLGRPNRHRPQLRR